MKVLAILLMLAGVFMIVVYGLFYLLGFAMSFDAPGSTTDPRGWMMRLLIFLPIVAMIIALIFAGIAFNAGFYKRSAIIASGFPIAGIIVFVAMSIMSLRSVKSFKETTAKQDAEWAELERLYPPQEYHRVITEGVDTIIVNSHGTVIFSQHTGPVIRYDGPIAALNDKRDTIVFYSNITQIQPSELEQFVNEEGRKLTENYKVN